MAGDSKMNLKFQANSPQPNKKKYVEPQFKKIEKIKTEI